MKLTIELKHLKELCGALQKAPQAVKKNLKLAMLVSLRNIQKRARSEHEFKSRSGTLERSIEKEIISDWPLKGRVLIDPKDVTVRAMRTKKDYNYGACLHEGTKAYTIEPFEKRALRFPAAGNGGMIFAKKVRRKAKKGDKFLYKAANKERDNINVVFNRYVLRALKEAGVNG